MFSHCGFIFSGAASEGNFFLYKRHATANDKLDDPCQVFYLQHGFLYICEKRESVITIKMVGFISSIFRNFIFLIKQIYLNQ